MESSLQWTSAVSHEAKETIKLLEVCKWRVALDSFYFTTNNINTFHGYPLAQVDELYLT